MILGMTTYTRGIVVHSSFRRRRGSLSTHPLGSGSRWNDKLVNQHLRGSLCTQRGAAALMATVFLLLIIAMLGGIGLRLSGTDIRDTALQNDSVEALFLAESGLERALQRLAAGTTCAGLAPDGVFTLGRGDFQIQSATVVGSICRVRVLGRRLLSGSFSAQRLIEGDLVMSSGGWAVGNNGTILFWDGSAWTTSGFTNNSPGNRDLYAISCATSADCWAVGDNGTIVRWNGSAWTTSGFTNDAPGNRDLRGVHCTSSTLCWAVGQNGTIVRWNGTLWTDSGVTSNAPNNRDLFAVHCLSSTPCWAVGERDSGVGTIVRLTGTTWSTSGFTNNTPNAHLRGVSCVSANDCWGVGSVTGGTEVIVRWNGTGWANTPAYSGVPNVQLNAVQCQSANSCWAVGNTSNNRGTIVRWNGSIWTNAGITNNSPDENLYAIHCRSATDCWATGDSGTSARLSGSSWSTVATPTGRDLQGVFFPGGSGGGGSGVQQWREIIP